MFYAIISSFAFKSVVRLIVGFILAGIIGMERSSWSKPAGFYVLGVIATAIVYIVLSYSYLLFSKLDHFTIFEVEITTKADNIEIMKSIQTLLKEQPIIVKHIANEEVKSDEEEKNKIIRISGKYSNKGDFQVSDLVSTLACIEGVAKVEESQSSVLN